MKTSRIIVSAFALAVAAFTALPACTTFDDLLADGAGGCNNGTRDGTEMGTDCGGACKACTGGGCTTNDECKSGACENGACKAGADKTCGVGTPTKCVDGAACELDDDCQGSKCTAGHCGGIGPDGKPVSPQAMNGKKDGDETDVDCGGTGAPPCALGKGCAVDGDCADLWCPADKKTCLQPKADDGIKNGTETDVDCGGKSGVKCEPSKACLVDGDCTSACNYKKKCVESPSCRPRFGGDTCGAGEIPNPMNHESCCRTLEVKGYTDPANPGKKVYLDKYEITAGRVRAFLEDITKQEGKPNVKGWLAKNPPKIWNPAWAMYLPSDAEADAIQTQHNPTNNTEQPPWNRNTGSVYQFNGQLFVYVHGHNCYQGAGSFGFPTFYLPDAEQQKNGGLPRLPFGNGFDTKDNLDAKAMTCISNAMLQAFCHWDGGQLATDDVLDFVTGTNKIASTNQFQQGANCTKCAPAAQVNATSDSGSGNSPNYSYGPQMNHEGVSRIAAPGRVAADVVRINAGDEPWMDLGGNLEEQTLYMNGANFSGVFLLKYRGIGFNSSRALQNPTAMQYPEYKAGYSGGRCMRFK